APVLFLAVEYAQNLKQAEEQIENSHEQRDGGQNVVGFTAVYDLAGLVDDQTAHQQNEHDRYGQGQRRDRKHNRNDAHHERDQDADGQHTGPLVEPLARHERIGGHADEDGAGAAECHGDQFGAIAEMRQVYINDRPERIAHEAGQCEDADQSPAAVGG